MEYVNGNLAREYAARRRGEAFDPLQYVTPETLILSPLPCWKHLSPERYREARLQPDLRH